MRVKFKSSNDLPLNKILSIPSLIIVVGSVFKKDNKYYPQVYLILICKRTIKGMQFLYNIIGILRIF